MWTLWVLLGVYAGTSALGTGIRLRLIDTSGFRWVHHALFGLIWLTLAASIYWSFTTNLPGRWLLLILVPCMALLPRFRAGSASHCLAAVGGLVVLIGIIVWALVSDGSLLVAGDWLLVMSHGPMSITSYQPLATSNSSWIY